MKSIEDLRQAALKRFALPEERLIYLAFRGSIAHGMYTPEQGYDDVDLMGVVVPPEDCYLGLGQYGNRGTREVSDPPWDVVTYEARKMVHLLAGCNPNVLACLFVRPEHIIASSDPGVLLLTHRHRFLSKRLYHTYTGYALAQLKRLRKQTRVGKRAGIVERYGYDVKHAAHLIRLLRMGEEALRTGELNVYREDAEQLLEIKRGERTLEDVEEESDMLFAACEASRDLSKLPDEVDRDWASRLCVEIVRMGLSRG